MSSLDLSMPILLIVSLSFSSLLYLLGSAMSEKGGETMHKTSTYACGEDLPAKKPSFNVERVFLYVTFFLVFDISAFILATSYGGPGLYPILFIAIVMVSAVTTLKFGRGSSGAD